MPKSTKSPEKIGGKFGPRIQAWKKEVQSVRIVLPSKFWLDFQGSQALQKAYQMEPEINKKWKQIRKSGSQKNM